MRAPWSSDELEQRIRTLGGELYHLHHPFHKMMVEGRLSKGQLQAWALNRYCYQAAIPRKDAILISRLSDPGDRRAWRRRLEDQDGVGEMDGGISRWLRLTSALQLDETMVRAETLALPQTRFAVGAYVDFVATRSVLEAVASSLTELFSPQAIGERVQGLLANYDFISRDCLTYFDARLHQAPQDASFALAYVTTTACTRDDQELVLEAVRFKCSVLWALLDALHYAYVAPGSIPPGCFTPDPA